MRREKVAHKLKSEIEAELAEALKENATLRESLESSQNRRQVAEAKATALEDLIKSLPIGGQTIHIEAHSAVNVGNASEIGNGGEGMNRTSSMFSTKK